MPAQVPSIGRIVHYVGANGQHLPAIIVSVFDASDDTGLDPIGCCIFGPTQRYKVMVLKDEEGTDTVGRWHWPEFVPARDARRGDAA